MTQKFRWPQPMRKADRFEIAAVIAQANSAPFRLPLCGRSIEQVMR